MTNPTCPTCQSPAIKYGKHKGRQRYRCKACNKQWIDGAGRSCYKPIGTGAMDWGERVERLSPEAKAKRKAWRKEYDRNRRKKPDSTSIQK